VPGIPRSLAVTIREVHGDRGEAWLSRLDDTGALLLERALPGLPLWDLPDEEAARIAAGLVGELWRELPDGHGLRPLSSLAVGFDRLRLRFDGGCGPLPRRLVERAEAMLAPVLLHGDLHHGNILANGPGSFLAIDPKGLAGSRGYDVGPFLRNALPWRAPGEAERRLLRRVEIFADTLALQASEVAGWLIAHAMLSAWWSIEDHGSGWEEALTCAELLDRHFPEA
jgi:streptomycin 6-kinase